MAHATLIASRSVPVARQMILMVLCLKAAGCSSSTSVPQGEIRPVPVASSACPDDFDSQQLRLGQKVYGRVCAACHGRDGRGTPGIFPPLIDHATRLAQSPQGRAYLANLVLWGLAGPIQVNHTVYRNIMPPQNRLLTDAEIAAALTYVTYAWGNCRAFAAAPNFTADAIEMQRHISQSAAAVYRLRADIFFEKRLMLPPCE